MSEPYTLSLGPDCTIRTIRTLHGEVTAALASTHALRLDCARTERADIALVQLVLSAAKTAERRGKTVELSNVPPPVDAAFRRAGVAPYHPFPV